jgi:glycosyltransferase involved in cell wall biosynthesis
LSAKPKILIFWQGASGYFAACVKELAKLDFEVHVVLQNNTKDVEFSFNIFRESSLKVYEFEKYNFKSLKALHDAINPDILMVSSWHILKYVLISRNSNALRVLCMDNQWLGTLKQRLGVLARQMLIQSNFDYAFLPGDRQRKFANLLGFPNEKIWTGLYTADTEKFLVDQEERQMEFIFAGRLVKEKGIENLVEAYGLYRSQSDNPLNLRVCGTGPELDKLTNIQGVILEGFVQPSELPKILGKASIFILPSKFEPWGVVIHEACASGLFILCTFECGASSYLVEDGWNGLIIPSGDSKKLSQAMHEAQHAVETDFDLIMQRSKNMAIKYSPKLWSKNLSRRYRMHQMEKCSEK